MFGCVSDKEIPDKVVKDNPYYAIVRDQQPPNILPGEQWNGDDLFQSTSFEMPYVITRPMLEWMEDNQFGPLLAYPFKVDVSRCTPEQRQRILSLVK